LVVARVLAEGDGPERCVRRPQGRTPAIVEIAPRSQYVNALVPSLDRVRRPVLLLDESHELRPDVLGMLRILTNFDMDSRLVLSLVIAGQTPLRALLARDEQEAMARRIIHYAQLRLLSRDELAQSRASWATPATSSAVSVRPFCTDRRAAGPGALDRGRGSVAWPSAPRLQLLVTGPKPTHAASSTTGSVAAKHSRHLPDHADWFHNGWRGGASTPYRGRLRMRSRGPALGIQLSQPKHLVELH
jgi:hypothetical protein